MVLVDEFLKYRAQIIRDAKMLVPLSAIDRLAVNFICHISTTSHIANKMPLNVWEAMMNNCMEDYRIAMLDDTLYPEYRRYFLLHQPIESDTQSDAMETGAAVDVCTQAKEQELASVPNARLRSAFAAIYMAFCISY
ncbi:hypothetical protein K492DRAFT_199657 [Lichtheimia hyalospora FSU 10163]|nr:hypothetical protein K492DRAFT_199657 [Lichtheimia hyalospora FSU 10163]